VSYKIKKITILGSPDRGGKILSAVLSHLPDFELSGVHEVVASFLEQIRELEPEVAVVDLISPREDGLQVIREIKDLSPATRVIVLTSYTDDASVHQALEAGADGYIVRGVRTLDLVRAVREETNRRPFLSPELILQQNNHVSGERTTNQDVLRPLSPREVEVLTLIVEGNSNKEVAVKLGISEATVKDHRKHIKEKLGLHDLPTLTRYAISVGLIGPDVPWA
jgi:NarL family two-component system response regulator LiaR